jgi:elongation factor G
MVLPMGSEDHFDGVINLLTREAYFWEDQEAATEPEIKDIPEEYQAEVDKMRAELVELIAETDDRLMEKFLNSETIEINELKAALRLAVIDYKLSHLCWFIAKNTGLQPFLLRLFEYLPSPLDIITFCFNTWFLKK